MDAGSTPPLRDVWYYALPGYRLKRGKMMAKTLLDEPVLIGRDQDGKVFALVDICPHRGIPLRFGTFDGREVECCYHGWRFNAQGTCTAMPSVLDKQLPDLTKVCVKSYPVEEVQGGIWIFFGQNPETAPPVPVIPELEGRVPQMVKTMVFDGSIDHAVIGLIDPSHATFVHKAWFWRSTKALRDKAKEFVTTEWGFTMKRHRPSSNTRAYWLLGGDRLTEIVFRLPGLRYEHIKTGRQVMCHLTTITPLTAMTTEINHSIFWTQPWLTPFKPFFWPFVNVFLRQDGAILSRQQLGLKHNPQLLLMGDPDVQARWYLRMKNEFARARQEGRPFVNPIKPRVLEWRT